MGDNGSDTVKNPPWLSQGPIMGMTQMQPQMMTQIGNTQMTVLQYPQAQMYQQPQMGQITLQQAGISMQQIGTIATNQITNAGVLSASVQPTVYPQLATVSYPTRTLIANPVVGNTTLQTGAMINNVSEVSSDSSLMQKQRVFTGTITKIQDNFGFVDEEVFFQTSCCEGGNPQVGDRVLVNASYNASMPFKWNASRIQVLPMENNLKALPPGSGRGRRFSNTPQHSFTDTPNAEDNFTSIGMGVDAFDIRMRNRGANRRNRPNNNRKRRRDEIRNLQRQREIKERDEGVEKEKERPKSPPRKVNKPPRTRIVAARSMGKVALDMPEADVLELKKRYTNMYIPSDFVMSNFKWVELFPPHRELNLERPCAFHILHKDVEPVIENKSLFDPPDADYSYSAKVMLLSVPELDEIYQKCCPLAEDKDESANDLGKEFLHPTQLMYFLVGQRGKEAMAIGGPWSPSLDGPNPDKDSKVLVKTAIRNCKALTGVDLSNCTQWYRFAEINYHRAEAVRKGKMVPARVETVVLYLPDVWNRLPTRLEWDGLHHNYKKKLVQLLKDLHAAEGDDKDAVANLIMKKEPTHYSKLDAKNMKINELREELESRNLPSKGLTSQLMARLLKVLKSEQEKEELENASKTEAEKLAAAFEKQKQEDKKRREVEEKQRNFERQVQQLEKRYTLPDKSHILVHPSKEAKSGKFDCTVMTLASLLDYKQEDAKEHCFEVALFAELFNEMLMRDFGFRIYKALVEAPEKPKEEKGSKGKDTKSERDEKSNTDQEEANSDNNSKNAAERNKKDKVKMVTVDPALLLAFVYLDHHHQGQLSERDLEELLFSLGLHLSRAQIKKLIQKVEVRGSINYRKLTDKPKDQLGKEQNGINSAGDLAMLAFGNKRMFPIFEGNGPLNKRRRKASLLKTDGLPTGSVMFKGKTVDIDKLSNDLKKSEDSRLKSEKLLEKLQSENVKLNDTSRRANAAITKLSAELEDFRERLTNTHSELYDVEEKTNWYFSLMKDMYEKITPVFASKQKLSEEIKDEHDAMDGMEEDSQSAPEHASQVFNIREANVKHELSSKSEKV